MNDNESWAHAFHYSFLVAFLPLNLLDWAQIELVWGTTNLFRAHYVFDMFTDVVLMTVLSVHVLYFAIRLTLRLAHRPRSA